MRLGNEAKDINEGRLQASLEFIKVMNRLGGFMSRDS